MMGATPLLVIVGPTAVGKTEFAIQLARALGGEIVSADSRQVYRGMTVGTAKPDASQRAVVPHHLIDTHNPDQTLNLSEFKQLAAEAIESIHARGRLPLLVGGTGQYIRALCEGWQVPAVPPDESFRAGLEAEASAQGHQPLWQRLADLDPEAAARIDGRNVRRVIRALEVIHHTGRAFSEQQRRDQPPFRLLTLGLTLERDELYHRADLRIQHMIAAGWAAEVSDLMRMGYGPDLPAFSSLGYREVASFLQGQSSLEAAVEQIRTSTRRFIRHQYRWFSLKDSSIQWLDASDLAMESIIRQVAGWRDA